MIIACEKCASKFQLDESFLKDEGSKVRCSVCQHVFTAYPTGALPVEEPGVYDEVDEALRETVALDSPPALEGSESVPAEPEEGGDFDNAFERAMEKESIPGPPPEDLSDEADGVSIRYSEGVDGAGESVLAGLEGIEDAEEAGEKPSAKEKPRRSRRLIVILLILFFLIAAGVAIFFFRPELIPDSLHFLKPVTQQEVTDLGVSRLNFKAVSGSFVESKEAGQLFVIKGMITNNYPRSRSHIFVKGSLLDDQGKVVRRKTSYAGNAFTEEELQGMSMAQIDEALKNKSGKGDMNVDVKPGSSIPIMIVFESLPDNLSEFTVEAVSSAPGQ